MKFGIAFANVGPFATGDGAAGFARAAEAAGFESVWTVEHVVVPAGYESTYPYSPTGKMPGPEDSPIPDPLIWLAYIAAATSTIRLGTGILILPQRNPVVLAKELATLDQMSGGRMELGIGVGWLEEEFDVLGIPFAGRGRRTDDYVAAMRALWTQEAATHHGEFASFDNGDPLAEAGERADPDHRRRAHRRGRAARGPARATASSPAAARTRRSPGSSSSRARPRRRRGATRARSRCRRAATARSVTARSTR